MPKPVLTEQKKFEIYCLFFSAHCTIVEISKKLSISEFVTSKYVSELIKKK